MPLQNAISFRYGMATKKKKVLRIRKKAACLFTQKQAALKALREDSKPAPHTLSP